MKNGKGTIIINTVNSEQICKDCGVCCSNCSDGYYHFEFFSDYPEYFDKFRKSDYPFLTKQLHDVIVKLRRKEFIKEDEIDYITSVLKSVFGDGVVWTKQRGFLTDSGCSIPRQFRSKDCLLFGCSKISPDMHDFETVKRKFLKA